MTNDVEELKRVEDEAYLAYIDAKNQTNRFTKVEARRQDYLAARAKRQAAEATATTASN